MAAISTVSSSRRRRLDRTLHAELAQEAGQERPPDLTLLFERHSLGHVLLSPSVPCSAAEPSRPAHEPFRPEPFVEPSPAAVRRRSRRRLAAVAAAAGRTAGARSRSRPSVSPYPVGAAAPSSCRPRRPVGAAAIRPLAPRLSLRWLVRAGSRLAAGPGHPGRPGLDPARRRRERSRRGRAPTGRTRARTRASTRMRPKRPVLGSLTTITSASPTATPSWSRARSVASSTVLPATSTHSTRLSSLSRPLRARPRMRLGSARRRLVVARRLAVRRSASPRRRLASRSGRPPVGLAPLLGRLGRRQRRLGRRRAVGGGRLLLGGRLRGSGGSGFCLFLVLLRRADLALDRDRRRPCRCGTSPLASRSALPKRPPCKWLLRRALLGK